MYLLLIHVSILRKKTASFSKCLPTAVRTYLLHVPDTRVPTDVCTHLLYLLHVPDTRVPTDVCTHLLYTAAQTDARW